MSGIALKLTSLLVRTVAKPIATALKSQAKEHESFRRACITIAQTVHSTDLKLRMSLLGEKKIKIRPLNDTKAVDNGATFLSELFIFSVAGSLIFYESYKSRKKATDERDALADDISVLQNEIDFIKTRLGDINIKLDDYVMPVDYKPKYIKLNTSNTASKTDESITKSEGSSSAEVTSKSTPVQAN
ncbi:optic atrophy 3 protein-domain-containing protein [Scheffersomyces xylosifermentans]|uniref:optic atrophy 3 protein-domain-containing protein n=1 Tax=Scheffersomyces xylosifermentans TaxID=1304137 RepID=UPI00315C7936